MYKLEKQTFGLKLTISGEFDDKEICQLAKQIASMEGSAEEPFSIFVDTREMITLDQSTLSALIECQKAVLRAGLKRSVVVLNSPVLKNQVIQVAMKSGISDRERYICATSNHKWEKDAMDWILNGVEPDPKIAVIK